MDLGALPIRRLPVRERGIACASLRAICISLLLTLLFTVPLFAAEPDYLACVRRHVPLPLAGRRPDFVDRVAQKPLRPYCEETAVLARLGEWTGRREYAEEAQQRLIALLDAWEIQRRPGKPWRRVCFFSAYPIIDAYRVLRAGGQLDEEFERRFLRFAPEAFFPQEEGPFNQAFARAAGLAWAAKTLPELPEASGWRKEAQKSSSSGDGWATRPKTPPPTTASP